MNKLISRRIVTLLVFLLIISSVSLAQFEKLDFLRSGPSDASKILKAYVSPWANAFGAGLNGGWYNTAKPHKFGGFDITTNISVGMVPSSAETFKISSLGLSSNISVTGSDVSPTIAGPNSNSNLPSLDYKVSGITLASFKTPPGLAWKYIPAPALQIGIGLPLGTELKVRYLPRISYNGSDISLWGVGLMHSIMQYIPGNKLSPFDISVFGGYTSLQGNSHLSLQPESSVATLNYTTGYIETKPFDNQKMNVTVTALNVSAIASVKLSVITFYGGVGYSKTNTVTKLTGNFPIPVPVLTPLPHAEYNNIAGSGSVIKGSDFKDMSINNFSGLRANIGFRLKLSIVTIHADYTWAMYSVVSAGLGFSFR